MSMNLSNTYISNDELKVCADHADAESRECEGPVRVAMSLHRSQDE